MRAANKGLNGSRTMSDKPHFINVIGVCENHNHRSRTHLALEKDSPETRTIQPPASGRIIAIPEIGGLHHRYERRAS